MLLVTATDVKRVSLYDISHTSKYSNTQTQLTLICAGYPKQAQVAGWFMVTNSFIQNMDYGLICLTKMNFLKTFCLKKKKKTKVDL